MSSQVVILEKTDFDAVTNSITTLCKAFEELNRKVSEVLDQNKSDQFLSTADVLRHYKISRSALNGYKKSGHIKYFQIGKNLRWPKSELDKFLSHK